MASLHHPLLEAAPRDWASCCVPDVAASAFACGASPRLRIAELILAFVVSSDEEFVGLQILGPGRVHDLGSRNHYYLLLTLARRRLADERAGLGPSAAGWVHIEELAHDPSMGPARLNLGVYRLRLQFAKLGLSDPRNIVERRPRASQLRIGAGRIAIARV